jgi:hypothetical protein
VLWLEMMIELEFFLIVPFLTSMEIKILELLLLMIRDFNGFYLSIELAIKGSV